MGKRNTLPTLRATRVNGTAAHHSLVSVETGGLVADAYHYSNEIVAACNSHGLMLAALRSIIEVNERVGGAVAANAALTMARDVVARVDAITKGE